MNKGGIVYERGEPCCDFLRRMALDACRRFNVDTVGLDKPILGDESRDVYINNVVYRIEGGFRYGDGPNIIEIAIDQWKKVIE